MSPDKIAKELKKDEDKNQLEGLTEDQIKAARAGFVPIDRLNEVTGKAKTETSQLRESMVRLEETVKALKIEAPGENKTAKIYTRAQLREFVTNEQITQDQSDDYWDAQQDVKFQKLITTEVEKVREDTEESTSTQFLKKQVDRYVELIPDIAEDGTDSRAKLSKEYKRLSKWFGTPGLDSKDDFKLQVAALESLFGTIDTVETRRRRASSNDDRETMKDISGYDQGDDKKLPSSAALKKLTGDQKAHYENCISNGIYKSWDDVEAELTWERKKKK